jgi:hypothetical protein
VTGVVKSPWASVQGDSVFHTAREWVVHRFLAGHDSGFDRDALDIERHLHGCAVALSAGIRSLVSVESGPG